MIITPILSDGSCFHVAHSGSGFALVRLSTGNWSFYYSNDRDQSRPLCKPQRTKWQAVAKLSKITPQHLLY